VTESEYLTLTNYLSSSYYIKQITVLPFLTKFCHGSGDYVYILKLNKGNIILYDFGSLKNYIYNETGAYPEIILLGVSGSLRNKIKGKYVLNYIYNCSNLEINKDMKAYRGLPFKCVSTRKYLEKYRLVNSVQVPVVLNDTNRKNEIIQTYIDAEICDMESYSVGTLCRYNELYFSCYRITTDDGENKIGQRSQHTLFNDLVSDFFSDYFKKTFNSVVKKTIDPDEINYSCCPDNNNMLDEKNYNNNTGDIQNDKILNKKVNKNVEINQNGDNLNKTKRMRIDTIEEQ